MDTRRVGVCLVSILFILALCSLSARAQFSSAMEGTVTDPSGAAVPGATVTLKNTQTGVTYVKHTTGAGFYLFPSLPPSVYSVTASAPGFKITTRENIAVHVTEIRTVNIALAVGAATERVTVSTAPAPVQLDEPSVTADIGGKSLYDLPLANRNFIDVFGLTPGVTGVPQANGNIFYTDNAVNLNAAGERTDSNNFIVDGASVTSPQGGPSGNIIVQPNLDSIQDVRVQVNNFSAEYGRNAGAQVSVVTKQGTNDWHGTVAEYHKDNTLTSRTEFESFIPVYRSNDISWTFGGPIHKDKTFFFATMDYLRSGNASAAPVVLPTPDLLSWMKQNVPNNLSTGILSKYPLSLSPTSNFTIAGSYAGVNCATLAAPSAPITTVAGTMPCNLPVVGQAIFSSTTPVNGSQWGARMDHMFNNSKDRIYGNFYRTNYVENVINPFPAFNQPLTVNAWLANIDETHTFAPNIVNEATLSWMRNVAGVGVLQPQIPFIDVIGMETINFELGPFTAAGNEPQFSDKVSWVHGRHDLKFGGSYIYEQNFGNWSGQSYRPEFIFLNPLQFAADSPFEEANIVYNPVTGGAAGLDIATLSHYAGLYVQDDFKMKPNFTLNFGLRWEDFGNPSARDNKMTNIVFQGGDTFEQRIANAKVNVVPNLYNSATLTNFEPRLGFAWDPTKTGKLSIRAGAGIFYDRPIDNSYEDDANNLPLLASAVASVLTPNFLPVFTVGTTTTPPYGYTRPPNIPIGQLDSKNGIIGANSGLYAMDPSIDMPRTGSVFFGIQYAFSPSWTLEADYLGTWGRHLFSNPDVNRSNGSLIQNNGVLVRPNTSFGQIGYGESAETSNYNGGTFAVTKRYSRGLSLQGSFTFGKAIDYSSTFVGAGDGPSNQLDISNLSLDRGLADFDISKKFAMTAIWDLPVPQFSSKFLSKTLNGWEISSILTLQSGPPFSVICSTPFVPVRNASGVIVGDSGCDYNADGFNYDRPNQPSFGNSLSGLNRSDYLKGIFTKSQFPAPPLGQEGALGRNTFFGPGFADTDLSLIKNTHIPWFLGKEGAILQIRGEFLNAFNRVNLSGVNSDLGLPFFGQSTAQFPARTIQVALRLQF